MLALAPNALGAAGDLDTTFGTGGRVIIDLGAADEVGGIAMQGDQAVITGSTLVGPTPFNAFALRLSTAGALDPGFGVGGSRIVDAAADTVNTGVAVRPAGSLVLGAHTALGTNPHNLAIAQLTPQGAVDAGFGVAGIRTVDMGGGESGFGPPALQADGAALLAGYRQGDFGVIRVDSAGMPDTVGFNPPFGYQFADVSGNDGAFAVAHQPDGKVLLVGSAAADGDIALVRLTAAGAFDNSFGGNPIPGEARVDIGGNEERATSVALLSDGRILVAGHTNAGPTPRNLFIARFGLTGSTDTGFGSGGVTIIDLGGDEVSGAHNLAVQPDGKILVSSGSAENLKVVRLTAGGSFDSSFGNGGVATIDSGGPDFAGRVALQPDGKILVAGTTATGVNSGNILVARLQGTTPPDPPSGPSATCAGKTATLTGTENAETLTGGDGDDVIAALGGKDKVNGGGGDDLVCAGDGNDTVKGGAGKDKLRGEDGKDKLSGGGGEDKLDGGKGKDKCSGGGGKDKLRCEQEKS
jgi:uncharacterized delta-60 repeat protein